MATPVWLEDPASVNGVTGDASTIHWDAVSGSVTFNTAIKTNGLGSWKCASGGGNAAASLRKNSIMADAGRALDIYFYVDSIPSSNATIIRIRNNASNLAYNVVLLTTGGLRLDGGSGSLSKNGTATVSTSTWYRLTLTQTITDTSTYTLKLSLSGVLDISAAGADGTLQNSSTNQVIVGWVTAPGANKNLYFQNVYIDDRTDNTDPASGDTGLTKLQNTSKRLNANGTANNFVTQIGSGGSGYGSGHSPQVNERPASDTNGWSVVAVAATTEEYNIESAATGDVNLSASTLVDYMAWVRAKSLIAETGQIILNNATSNISLTSTITTFTKIAGSTTYPAGTGTDIGIVTSATATTVSLYEAGVVFAYNYVAPSAVSIPVFDHYYRLQRQ